MVKNPRRIAFYGGSFDPVHRGHLAIAEALIFRFQLDQFTFIPAFHAPHKVRLKPTSAYDRYAMLALSTNSEYEMSVSRIEIEQPERPFSVETLSRLNEIFPDDHLFFVMGADSWMDITTWREWETVLSLTDHIVVTRPGYELSFDHVTDEIRGRIRDLRNGSSIAKERSASKMIYITDAVNIDISATDIRAKARTTDASWQIDVTSEVAKYIEKYQIYK